MDYKKLAELLYPNVKKTVADYFEKYPLRNIPTYAEVTRVAPSPTGFLHLGTFYQAVIDKKIAEQSGGVFCLRIEDTDKKREVAGASKLIYDILDFYGITPDEGYFGDTQKGNYGSYVQSERIEIYNTFAKFLVEHGRAFPCFCEKAEDKAEILEKRAEQIGEGEQLETKDACRNLTLEQIEENLKNGKPFALRLLSIGNIDNEFKFVDLAKGERIIRENDKDIVLIKSNGIPVYAFAHVVDDTLMHTTTVVRGEEWFPSVSAHIEIFKAFGFTSPKYLHTPVICKLDKGNKRKLSKRKDAEADMRFYIESGYPNNGIIEYVLNLANSNFELWRISHPQADLNDYKFSTKNIGSNNPMFDIVKLNDTCKNVVSTMSSEEIFEKALLWSAKFNEEFYNLIKDKKEYFVELLNVDRTGNKPRKDIAKWSDIQVYYFYMFNELFEKNEENYEFDETVSLEDIKAVLKKYLEIYDENDDKQQWFEKIKSVCEPLGFCSNMKEFKQNPEAYKGSVATISGIIRVALTKKQNTPDLYFLMKLLGKENISQRINKIIKE